MSAEMGARRFGRMNWLGLYTLIWREVMRFATVWSQTILAPLVTAALFIAIFSLAIGAKRGDVMGVPFVHFIAPGILMMTVIRPPVNLMTVMKRNRTLCNILWLWNSKYPRKLL